MQEKKEEVTAAIPVRMAERITGELADIIRQRIAEFTPVTNGYEAVILAYTMRTFMVLAELAAQLDGFDVKPLQAKLIAERNKAQDAGFWIDSSIWE
jgi:hypothetical protein